MTDQTPDPMVALLHEAQCGPQDTQVNSDEPWDADHREWDIAVVKALRLLGFRLEAEAAQPAPLDERYRALVTFVADRLVHVYGESPNTDYIIGLREAASAPLPSLVDITGIDPIIRAADERYRALVEAARDVLDDFDPNDPSDPTTTWNHAGALAKALARTIPLAALEDSDD